MFLSNLINIQCNWFLLFVANCYRSLAHNELHTMRPDLFAQLTSLTHLDLSNNPLATMTQVSHPLAVMTQVSHLLAVMTQVSHPLAVMTQVSQT
jgi:hypothetical protein